MGEGGVGAGAGGGGGGVAGGMKGGGKEKRQDWERRSVLLTHKSEALHGRADTADPA